MNAAALKYYVLVSMFIFLGIAFSGIFSDSSSARISAEGIGILPVVLGANVLNGVWLNLSFWYKREERTSLAIVVTFVGLIFTIGCSLSFYSPLGILRSSLGSFSQRSGDGCGKFLAQPPFLSHALPDRTDFGICGVGAGSIRRECRRG